MKDLNALFEKAAGSEPVGFDNDDVRSRVERRRRRQRIVPLVAVLALFLVGTLAWVRLGTNDGPSGVTTSGTPEVSDLTADRWVVVAVGVVTSTDGSPWIELQVDGQLTGYDGCDNFERSWTLTDDVLQTSLGSQTHRECPPGSGTGLIELLDAGTTVGRPPGAANGLDFVHLTPATRPPEPTDEEDPPLGITLRSFTSLGETPTPRDLLGPWMESEDELGSRMAVFASDGTETVSLSGCQATATWHLEGDMLDQRYRDGCGLLLGTGPDAGGIQLGDEIVHVRLEKGSDGTPDTLHVASTSSLEQYTRQEP